MANRLRCANPLNALLGQANEGPYVDAAIARANRVTSWKIDGKEKKNGEIVDYYNVFRNMRKALKD